MKYAKLLLTLICLSQLGASGSVDLNGLEESKPDLYKFSQSRALAPEITPTPLEAQSFAEINERYYFNAENILNGLKAFGEFVFETAKFVLWTIPHEIYKYLKSWIESITISPKFSGDEKAKHVVLINIDGLNPKRFQKFIDSSSIIKEAVKSGSRSSQMIGVFPAKTSAILSSAVTGEYPDTHKCFEANIKDRDRALLGKETVFEVAITSAKTEIQCQSILDALKAQGLKSAAIGWLVSEPSSVLYNIPLGIPKGIWAIKSIVSSAFSELSKKSWTDFMGSSIVGNFLKIMDDVLADIAAKTIKLKKPNLVLLEQTFFDCAAHLRRTDSVAVSIWPSVYRENTERIIQAAKDAGIYDDTVFCLMSDHWIFDVDKYVHLNNLFLRNGFIALNEGRITKCDAYGEADGLSFTVKILNNAIEIKKRVRTLLKEAKESGKWGIDEILGKKKLRALGSESLGDMAVTVKPSYMFVTAINKERDVAECKYSDILRSHHCHNPLYYPTNFVIWGSGIKKGEIGKMNVIDIAPTIAKVLGIDFKCSGRALDVFK